MDVLLGNAECQPLAFVTLGDDLDEMPVAVNAALDVAHGRFFPLGSYRPWQGQIQKPRWFVLHFFIEDDAIPGLGRWSWEDCFGADFGDLDAHREQFSFDLIDAIGQSGQPKEDKVAPAVPSASVKYSPQQPADQDAHNGR